MGGRRWPSTSNESGRSILGQGWGWGVAPHSCMPAKAAMCLCLSTPGKRSLGLEQTSIG